MPSTAKWGLRYPQLGDAADVPLYIQNLASDVDAAIAGYYVGTNALKPAAGKAGRIAYETDTKASFIDDGVAWQPINIPQATVTLGAVMDWPWAAGSIPAWTVLPYGQLLTQAAFPAMQVIADAAGRPYGGVAATNFNTPDYRGRIGAGKDDMGGTAANRITAAISGITGTTLGAAGGSEGITLTTGQIPAHNHPVTGTPGLSDPGHFHTTTFGYTNLGASGGDNVHSTGAGGASPATDTKNTDTKTTGITATLGTLSTSNAGSGGAHPNVQPTIIVNKIMRVL